MNEEQLELFQKRDKAINMENIPEYVPTVWDKFRDWLHEFNPLNKYVSVQNVEQYASMPRRDRTVWGIFYKRPFISNSHTLLGRKSDRDALDAIVKKEFPIQSRIRNAGFYLAVRIDIYYDHVRYFLNPRQKWLTKQIPNEWQDKVSLIPLVNFAMVIHFVEQEDAVETTDWEGTSDVATKFRDELLDCYDYVKFRRPQLQKDLEASYPDDDTRTGKYEVDYAETNRLELLINKEDTKYLVWIVTNRDYFWT